MHQDYLGDSFDFVKRFWAENLRAVAPLYAHPRFVPAELKRDFEAMTSMTVLDLGVPPRSLFGLFLDPHTGIPLPEAVSNKVTLRHAPIKFIVDEMERLAPRYLVCFDQSHHRSATEDPRRQRRRKQDELERRGVHSFYYKAQAPFLFAATRPSVLDHLRRRLLESGLPADRIEG